MAGRFIDKPTPEDLAAIQALRLTKRPTECFANAVASERRNAFIKQYRLRESRGLVCPRRLVGKHCQIFKESSNSQCACQALLQTRVFDHTTLWTRDGKPYLISAEPYHLEDDGIRALQAVCEELGLVYGLSTRSFYYPAVTFLITLGHEACDDERILA